MKVTFISSVLLYLFPINALAEEDWMLVFKVATAGAGNVYNLYIGNDTLNVDNIAAQSLTHPINEHFKSDVVNRWSTLPIEQVRIAVYKNSTEIAFYLFNGTGSDKMNWFSPERLMNSSYTDLLNGVKTSSPPINVFSITGLESDFGYNFLRRFYINSCYGGCPIDETWLFVLDVGSTDFCDFAIKYFPVTPAVLFSPKSIRSKFSSEINNILAESLAVFVKFTDTNWTCQTMCLPPVQISANSYCYQPCTTGMNVEKRIAELRKDLLINKTTLSSYKRGHISVYEDRVSAKAIGSLGVVIVIGVISLFVIMDCVNLKRHLTIHHRKTN